MKVKLATFVHCDNGLSLFLVPESDIERQLLQGFFKHGSLEKCNGIADDSEQGFCIQWRCKGASTAERIEATR